MKNYKMLLTLIAVLGVSGCASFREEAKLLWGSSTSELESVRNEASRSTFSCSWEECFNAVVKYANVPTASLPEPALHPETMNQTAVASVEKPIKVKNLDLFLQDRERRVIVVMGIPGSVNTTEVGLFFTPLDNRKTLVEVTSLSTSARVRAADIVFTELGKQFTVVN